VWRFYEGREGVMPSCDGPSPCGFAPASSSKEEDISKVTLTPLKHKGEKAAQQGSASLEDTSKAIFLMSIYIY
jgi:hypothetical protein